MIMKRKDVVQFSFEGVSAISTHQKTLQTHTSNVFNLNNIYLYIYFSKK